MRLLKTLIKKKALEKALELYREIVQKVERMMGMNISL